MKLMMQLGVVCGLAYLTLAVYGEEPAAEKQSAAIPVVASNLTSANAGESSAGLRKELPTTKKKGRKTEPATPAKVESSTNFGVEIASLGDGRFAVIRWDLKTGKAWNGVEGVMTEIAEINGHQPAAGGQYQIKLTNTRPGRIAAVRVEVGTGKLWHLDDRRWIPMVESKL